MAVEARAADTAVAEGCAVGGARRQPWPRPAVAWYAVAVFAIVLMLGELDRGVIGLLVQPIKRDFDLTDVKVSYLIGLAQNFWQLFGLCVAAGGGGAMNGPGTYSMMADYLPREKLPRAIAVLQVGYVIGGGMPLVLGAVVIAAVAGLPTRHIMGLIIRNWQMAFIIAGLPGLIGALLLLTVPEPPRRGLPQAGPSRDEPTAGVIAYLIRNRRVYGPMFFGLAFSALETYGVAFWRPTFFIRTYGWTAQQAGLTTGLAQIGAALIGLVAGTLLTEALAKKYDDANMRVLAIFYTATPVFAILGPLMPNPWLAVGCAAATYLCGLAGAVPQNAALQSITPNRMRGRVTALYLFVFVVIGYGLGPSFIAFVTDHIVRDESLIRFGMAGSAAVMTPIAALLIWLGVRPYGQAIAQVKAQEASGGG